MKKRKTQRHLFRGAFCLLSLMLLLPSAGTAKADESTAAGEVIEHQVVEGDSLSLMAGYYYRNPRLWKKIYALNSDAIDDPDLILPGMTVKVPADPTRQWDIPYRDFLSRIFD